MNDNNSTRHILAIESSGWKKNFFLDKNTYSVGRSSTNAIVIHHRVISRNHATFLKVTYQGLSAKNTVFWIIDGDLKGNRSTNGIYINGKRCLSQQLQPGDVILLGGVEVRAKYDIIDLNSRSFYSETRGDDFGKDSDAHLHQEDDQVTSIATRELNREPLMEEFVRIMNEIRDPETYQYLTVNSKGNIREISKAAQSLNDLDTLKIEHPLFKDFNFTLQQNHHKLLVRDFNLDDKNFTQYIYYSEKSDLITTYLLSRSQKQQLEIKLRENEERYRDIIKQISEGIFFVDLDTKEIIEVNQVYCQLLGYSETELLRLALNDILTVDQDILAEDLNYIINYKTSCIRESINRCKDGSLINVELSINIVIYEGKETLCFCVRDITERKKVEEILRYQSSHDTATNLPNQKLFKEQLFANLANNKETQQELVLILIKIREFQQINYALGDEISNQLLQYLVKKIKSCLAIGDVLARWADNELIILLPEISSEKHIKYIIEQILVQVNAPLMVEEFSFYLTLSMGVVLFPHHGKKEPRLIQNLHTALIESDKKSGSNYQFYQENFVLSFRERFELKNIIYKQINKQNFYLRYEPQINVLTNQISTLRTILKVPRDIEELKNVSELDLLEIAEEMGLSQEIFNWTLQTICEHYQIWLREQDTENFSIPKISLKVLFSTLKDHNLARQITNTLDLTEMNCQNLELEIICQPNFNYTQSWELAYRNLLNLVEEGISLCVSNFDLEKFTNINEINLPINTIKISEKIVNNLANNLYNQYFVKSMLLLGKELKATIFAEKVSEQEILDILSNLQCREISGKIITKPLSSEKIPNLLSGKSSS